MKQLFQGFIINQWNGTSFRKTTKCVELNKVIIKHCVDFYLTCSEDRNQKLHNPTEQRIRVIDWYEREKEDARKGEFPQIKKCVESNPININNTTAEHMQRWIFLLKDLKKKAEKHKNREDTRGFFVQTEDNYKNYLKNNSRTKHG